MNSIKKITISALMALFATAATAADPIISLTPAQAKDDRSSLLSNRGASRSIAYELDFIAGDKGAAVVQFDVIVKGKGDASIDLSRCEGKSVAGSDHRVFCRQISSDRVRVLVDSPTNSVVTTTSFGTIVINGGRASIESDSVVVGDPQAASMAVEVL